MIAMDLRRLAPSPEARSNWNAPLTPPCRLPHSLQSDAGAAKYEVDALEYGCVDWFMYGTKGSLPESSGGAASLIWPESREDSRRCAR